MVRVLFLGRSARALFPGRHDEHRQLLLDPRRVAAVGLPVPVVAWLLPAHGRLVLSAHSERLGIESAALPRGAIPSPAAVCLAGFTVGGPVGAAASPPLARH